MYKDSNNVIGIQIKNNEIKENQLKDALSLIYGFRVEKKLEDIDDFYKTLKFLEMSTAVKQLEQSLVSRVYDLSLKELLSTLNFLLRSNLKKAMN